MRMGGPGPGGPPGYGPRPPYPGGPPSSYNGPNYNGPAGYPPGYPPGPGQYPGPGGPPAPGPNGPPGPGAEQHSENSGAADRGKSAGSVETTGPDGQPIHDETSQQSTLSQSSDNSGGRQTPKGNYPQVRAELVSVHGLDVVTTCCAQGYTPAPGTPHSAPSPGSLGSQQDEGPLGSPGHGGHGGWGHGDRRLPPASPSHTPGPGPVSVSSLQHSSQSSQSSLLTSH